jgi:chorismate mutase
METQPIAIRTVPTITGPVHEVVRQAHEELRQLLQQRAEVMRRIGTVKQTIAGLANLFGDEVLSDELLEMVDRKSGGRQPGFTKACRMILMEANRALSAREVCDRIQERIPPMLARHKDPMASVTTVLNRLVAYGEAKAVTLDNGRRAWQWVADSASEVSPEVSSLAPQ